MGVCVKIALLQSVFFFVLHLLIFFSFLFFSSLITRTKIVKKNIAAKTTIFMSCQRKLPTYPTNNTLVCSHAHTHTPVHAHKLFKFFACALKHRVITICKLNYINVKKF